MTTFTTKTIVATIDAPFDKVAADLAEPSLIQSGAPNFSLALCDKIAAAD